MTSLFTELIKFFSEFTWRKLVSVVVMMVGFFMIISIYELYTSSFRFSRLQKAADLLSRVEEIDSHGTNNAPELENARKALIAQIDEAIRTKPLTLEFIPSTLKFSLDGVWKFLAGSALWLFFALIQIKNAFNPKTRPAFVGFLLVAVITGFCGMFVPSIWWPWFHIIVFPWILLACIIIALLPVGYIAAKSAAKKKALEKAKQVFGPNPSAPASPSP